MTIPLWTLPFLIVASRSEQRQSIPIDHSMILNAKEAEKAGMDRITISVLIKDILYASPFERNER